MARTALHEYLYVPSEQGRVQSSERSALFA